jgi:hypothetical protein
MPTAQRVTRTMLGVLMVVVLMMMLALPTPN